MPVDGYRRKDRKKSPSAITLGLGGGGLVTKSSLTLATPWAVALQAPLYGISQASILK